jgi:hypothetical protein
VENDAQVVVQEAVVSAGERAGEEDVDLTHGPHPLWMAPI